MEKSKKDGWDGKGSVRYTKPKREKKMIETWCCGEVSCPDLHTCVKGVIWILQILSQWDRQDEESSVIWPKKEIWQANICYFNKSNPQGLLYLGWLWTKYYWIIFQSFLKISTFLYLFLSFCPSAFFATGPSKDLSVSEGTCSTLGNDGEYRPVNIFKKYWIFIRKYSSQTMPRYNEPCSMHLLK